MSQDGELFIQSDVLKLIKYMSNLIDDNIYFDRKLVNGFKYLEENPYKVSTDRELFVLKQNLPIYRAMYIRNSKLFIN